MSRVVESLIALSKRTPYFDIYNGGGYGDLYMGRDWLMPKFLLLPDPDNDGALKPKAWVPVAVRLHHIARADLDRDCHDHPWTFISIVLRGGYVERLPTSMVPNWRATSNGFEEDYREIVRKPGSIALRRYSDRHRIVSVEPGTVTLVIVFRKRQSWGFFTQQGKVHWQDYDSVHNAMPIERAA